MKRSDLPTVTVLRTVAQHGGTMGVALLMQRAPRKVVLAAVERDAARGYLDYGVSACHPWLEPRGVAYLRAASSPAGSGDADASPRWPEPTGPGQESTDHG
ncbi:MAG TPA: hypothetical protein VFM54_05300 [Micromonosporaceae bacterium]|nr:hypothetical protein [Micromonosporaceae bacterium]